MTERMVSSMPIRSRMTLLLILCQSDSLSTGFVSSARRASQVRDDPSSWFSFPSTLSAWSWFLVDPLVWSKARLRVSFSISSRSTFDCSVLHFSILSHLVSSRRAPSTSSIVSSRLCTLDLLLLYPVITFRGLYCSKFHICSWTGGLDAAKVPKPS